MTRGEGRAGDGVVRVALAQIDCDLGDVAANARRVRETLAAVPDADLVVFPELALTGYQATGAGDVALAAADPEITALGGAAGAFGVGFAEGAPPHTHHAAAHVEARAGHPANRARLRRGRRLPPRPPQAQPADVRHLAGAPALHAGGADAGFR